MFDVMLARIIPAGKFETLENIPALRPIRYGVVAAKLTETIFWGDFAMPRSRLRKVGIRLGFLQGTS